MTNPFKLRPLGKDLASWEKTTVSLLKICTAKKTWKFVKNLSNKMKLNDNPPLRLLGVTRQTDRAHTGASSSH